MGLLDERGFEAAIAGGCKSCKHSTLEIHTFLDRTLRVMLADPNDAGRWAHDGEKFIDGVYRIACVACRAIVFESDVCPRCHAPGKLAAALVDRSRLEIPRRCASCQELELLAIALVPATARYAVGQAPKPAPAAEFGEPGFHVVAFACESCDAAIVTQACPLCDAPGPLRARP